MRGVLFVIHASCVIRFFFIGCFDVSRMRDFSENMTNTEVNLLPEGKGDKKKIEYAGGMVVPFWNLADVLKLLKGMEKKGKCCSFLSVQKYKYFVSRNYTMLD